MSIAMTVEKHLAERGVPFDLVTHPRTPSATRSAQAAHISGECVAKTVVLHDQTGYMLAVVPATHRIELDTIQRLLDRRLSMATEGEIATLFEDCDLGAVPPLGDAYGVEVLVEETLSAQPEVYFEGGDHTSLVHVTARHFADLMGAAKQGRFSHHV